MLGFNRPFISARTPCCDPRNPNYDDGREDAIADEAIEGTWSLKHATCELLRALADLLDQNSADDEHAARELLMPLYAEQQSVLLKKLHAWFSKSDSAQDVAALAIEREFAA